LRKLKVIRRGDVQHNYITELNILFLKGLQRAAMANKISKINGMVIEDTLLLRAKRISILRAPLPSVPTTKFAKFK